jgi:hypothetical protein
VSDSETGNGKDLGFERAQLRRRLAELSAKDRLEALLDAPDAMELVQSVPAEDLYAAIAEVGLANSTEIVQLASPEQFRTFVDLGAWTKDSLDVDRAITWLRAARGEESPEFLAKVRNLDLEILELILRSSTRLHDKEQDPDVDPAGVTLETPEGKYLVEFLVEGAQLSAMRSLVSDLIAENPFEAIRLFEAIRWELPTELEEAAFQFRLSRLADLGFPPLDRAAAIFSFADPGPGAPSPEADREKLTGPVPDYLAAAFRGMTDDEREQLEEQLRYLANSALVAEAAEPGDPVAGRRVAEMVRNYLSLGFEHLCGPDLRRATAVLREAGLAGVFRTGFSLTLKLKFRVDRLDRHPLARPEGELLVFPEEARVLSALRQKRPARALPIEGAEPVGFRSKSELHQAEGAIARAEQQVESMGALLGGTSEKARQALALFEVPLRELGVDRLFAAIAANALLDSSVRVAPLDPDRLGEFVEKLIDVELPSAPLRASVVEHVYSALMPSVPAQARAELHRQVERTLSDLAADVGPGYQRGQPVDLKVLVNLPLRGNPGL